jgi:hypothetical protein
MMRRIQIVLVGIAALVGPIQPVPAAQKSEPLRVDVQGNGEFRVFGQGREFLRGCIEGVARPAFQIDGPATIRCTSPGRVTATVTWGRDAFLCRLQRPASQRVVQLSIGRVESRLADALFDPEADNGIRFEGQQVRLVPTADGYTLSAERLTAIRLHCDVYKTTLGIKWYRPLDRDVFPRAPCGWCTWYYYYHNVTEADVLENARWLAKHLKRFGATVCQIDDGWQSPGSGGDHRDWFRTSPRFPQGMRWLAQQIRALGLVPGIWLCPFGQSDRELAARQPELFLRTPDGRSIGEPAQPGEKVNWNGRYFLDCTGKAGQEYLRRLFTLLAVQWGYDYIKIDGQGGIAGTYDRYQKQLATPLPGDEAYRRGLRAMVDVMGPRRFLLSCAHGFDSAGLCQGLRIGGDVGCSWRGMQPAIDATMRWLFVNTRAWYTDPDVVCVRPPLTLDQARMWATLVGITGQMTLASDKMTDLAEERIELLRRICPVADIRPMDLFDYQGRPPIFDLKVATGADQWDVVAVFNWTDATSTSLTLTPADLGLPPGRYVYYDVWAKRLVAAGSDAVTVHLPPSACQVLTVRPQLDRPQLLGTSRHITQGADDLEQLAWDDGSATLSGTSRLVADDPYELRFTLPPGWSVQGKQLRNEGPLAVLTLRSPQGVAVAWEARFRRSTVAAAPPLPPEAAPFVAQDGRVTLAWKASPRAMAYHVFRNGKLLGATGATTLVDAPLRPQTVFHYEVAAVDWTGELSARTQLGQFQTPPARAVWLDQLQPINHWQSYGTLVVGRSNGHNPLTIGGKVFQRGLGMHAHAESEYLLGGGYRRLEAYCGVDDEKGGLGSCVFQVWADGQKLFDSGVLRGRQPARQVSVDLIGRETLRLVVTDAGDGINCDHADWADARLVP